SAARPQGRLDPQTGVGGQLAARRGSSPGAEGKSPGDSTAGIREAGGRDAQHIQRFGGNVAGASSDAGRSAATSAREVPRSTPAPLPGGQDPGGGRTPTWLSTRNCAQPPSTLTETIERSAAAPGRVAVD